MTIFDHRRSGVLLHISSLPGPHGSGDFGPGALHFIDWLHAAGQRVWQVLPLTPIGPGHSPYQSVSAFAGNPLLVALEPLVDQGWLAPPELPPGGFPSAQVNFDAVGPWRMAQLHAAAAGFFARATAADRGSFAAWCETQAHWLADYALFMAIEAAHAGQPWWDWGGGLARREPAALAAACIARADDIAFWQFVQWCFAAQWDVVRAYAQRRSVALLGDLPIFIAHHSADCWARPDLYRLDEAFQPTAVAGVPPDFFSATGQRWGNPLYRWERMATDGYAWWIARVRHALTQADGVRIDHFRGFAACWEIPADCATAIGGCWVPGPGRALFDALERALGAPLPIVAEDLGVITEDVEALRDGCGFPGMRILQFAFGDDARNAFLPHNYTPHTVAYSGTHDNDTTRGWWHSASDHERRSAGLLLNCDEANAAWAMVHALSASVAQLVVFPMQDVLGLGSEARMNIPGTMGGTNWRWRLEWHAVGAAPAERLRALGIISGRTCDETAVAVALVH